MSNPERQWSPSGSEMPRELADLSHCLDHVQFASEADEERIKAAMAGVTEMVNRRGRVFHLVQEALSQLRLDLKYLMFDLDVTRKERDELRSRLNEIERGY